MPPLVLLLLATDDPDALIASARARIAAEHRCDYTSTTDVTVCGMRGADRFRVPLVAYDPGDPAHEGVPAERERLLHRTTPVQDLGPFQVGGGMAGVSVSSGAGRTAVTGVRPLAP